MDSKRRTNDIDHYIGKSLKALRKAKGLSQNDLGDILGVTFQQVQKYELGQNRLSAASLYKLSLHFEVSLDSFFKQFGGIEKIETLRFEKNDQDFEGIRQAWPKLEDNNFKKIIVSFVKEKVKSSH